MKPIPINKNQKPFWDIKASTDNKKSGDIYIYGYIVFEKWEDSDVTASSFKKDLDALGDVDTLNIYVNSGGGSVFQAQAIYSILKRHTAQKNGYIDGIAASAATFILMACDRIHMPTNANFMVHKPMGGGYGNVNDLRKVIEMLEKIEEAVNTAYLSHIGNKITEDKLKELLDAETWMTAQEAFDYGFVDEIIEAKEIAACVDSEVLAAYKNVPKNLVERCAVGVKSLSVTERQAIIEESKKLVDQIKNKMEVL